MPFINDEIFDQGLDYADANGTRLYLCSQEPTTYTEATSTYALAVATVNTSVTQDGAVSGRRVQVPIVSSGSVTGTGTVTHWALTNAASLFLAENALGSSQSVTSGNTFSTNAPIDVGILDAVSV